MVADSRRTKKANGRESIFYIVGSSKTMFIGTLIHELLQICLDRQAQTRPEIEEQVRLVLQRPAILRDMLLLQMTRHEVRQEVDLFLPHILYFTEK